MKNFFKNEALGSYTDFQNLAFDKQRVKLFLKMANYKILLILEKDMSTYLINYE